MKRLLGMMPSEEVKMEKSFQDDMGLHIRIQAGPHGWTIFYADASSEYADSDASTEENFEAALATAIESLGNLKEIKGGMRDAEK